MHKGRSPTLIKAGIAEKGTAELLGWSFGWLAAATGGGRLTPIRPQ